MAFWRVAIEAIAAGLHLGSVTIKDGVLGTLAKVAAAAGIVEADAALAVQAAVLGLAGDAAPADLAVATGSHSAKLRALVQLLNEVRDAAQHGLKIADGPNVAIAGSVIEAEAGAYINDMNWHQVGTAPGVDLDIGRLYELVIATDVSSDSGTLEWVTQAAVGDPGAVKGRILFPNVPRPVVPMAGHVRVYVKAITNPNAWSNGNGYKARLEPTR